MSKSPAVITLTMHTLPPSYTETVPHAAKLGLANNAPGLITYWPLHYNFTASLLYTTGVTVTT